MARGKPPKIKEFKYNFEHDVAINVHKLDRCWLEQPTLMMRYGELQADADRVAKRAKEKVKTIRSEITLVAARDGIPGVDKPTGGVIEAHYRDNEEYKEAKSEMIDAEHTASILKHAVDALRNRRDALSNLVTLLLAGYFSSPKEPKGSEYGKEADSKQSQRVDERARRKLKNRDEEE